ncbi:DUF4142 domain-containing protein [Amycolatopsis sp. NEAU-NG30]|uniref:DUF4142 domain-containing protein n=1 Tax=Amycolatopsis melonis TaxID=3156488 RepID=A0ABV0LNW1_9PSEU
MRSIAVIAAILGALLPAATPASAADVSTQDREYLNRAHQSNLFEIVTGNLAERGECTRVRQLGPRFAAHHTELDADLVAVATRVAVPLYSVPEADQLGQITDLASRSGPDFDAAWLRDQFAAHVRAIELGEREQRIGWSPEVKSLAARSEPVLRHHLEEVQEAAAECTPG